VLASTEVAPELGQAAAATPAEDGDPSTPEEAAAGKAFGTLALFPSHVVRRAIGEAASRGDTWLVHTMVLNGGGGHLNNPCGVLAGTRRTPLQCAAAGGHGELVQLLLRHRAEPLATAEGGRTALHLAAEGGTAGHAACVNLLLRYGADASQPDIRGSSAIDVAPDESATAALLALLGGADASPPRYWKRPQPPPCLLLPARLAAREAAQQKAAAAARGPKLSVGCVPGAGPTHVRTTAADLPGGPLRYRIVPAPAAPPQPYVSELVVAPTERDEPESGAWWSMQHPYDQASTRRARSSLVAAR
jgi:hypothetical protein